MVFSSTVFLFIFLPITLLVYFKFAKSNKVRNIILLIASLIFYAYGEPLYVLLMILSIIINYIFGILIDKYNNHRRLFLIISIIFNISTLFIFKYLNFTLGNLSLLFNSNFIAYDIVLPIGISFYTFQIMSYVVDVYRKTTKVQKNILNLGLYVSMFPQLIAGPIVRYNQVANEIENREHTKKDYTMGFKRFIYGLGKKVILANYLAIIADNIFAMNNISMATAWFGAISYTLQIFFDFSGYSDMAIGLGQIFGFHFAENFNYPYIANSITDFWRRWHISLSSWFKEYVYIPLGGNRVKFSRMVLNLFIVWTLTGLWHGANWTFIIWGLFYFVLLFFEKITKIYKNKKFTKVFGHFYAMFFVIIGWVIFRSDNINNALIYVSRMFDFNNIIDPCFIEYLKQSYILIIVCIISSIPLKKYVNKYFNKKVLNILESVLIIVIFALSLLLCIKSTYNPFIYFNF